MVQQVKPNDGSDWLSVAVGTGLPVLAALTGPWVSLPIAFVALLLLSVVYRRRSNSRVGWVASLLGAAVIAGAMVYLWMRGRR